MKHLLAIFLVAICATAASAQTIRTLGYNSTNGQIVAATNVTWTNSFGFSTNAVAAQVRTNLLLGWSGLTNTNASGFRSALELSATWLTNTNVTNFRTAIGLGATNDVTFNAAEFFTVYAGGISVNEDGVGIKLADDSVNIQTNGISFSTNAASGTRTNLGLPLAALTNTSNVTMMRTLSGSTNTNHPFSGNISVTGTNNTNTLVFSNGILQSVQ